MTDHHRIATLRKLAPAPETFGAATLALAGDKCAALRSTHCIEIQPQTTVANPGFRLAGPCAVFAPVQSHWPGEFGSFSYSWSPVSRYVAHVGRYCSIGPGVAFGDWEHPVDWLTTSNAAWDAWFVTHDFARRRGLRTTLFPDPNHDDRRQIVIGNDVWIGTGAYIRQGVVIGDGAIIGRNAVITKDVPPYGVVVGNPGRLVKYRFPERLVERLLETAWWRFCFADFEGIDMRDAAGSCDLIQELAAQGRLREFRATEHALQELT